MFKIARCIIKNEKGEILLIKHKNKDFWVFPGGHIEDKEEPYAALKREIKEELGLDIKIIGDKLGLKLKNITEKALPITVYKIKYKNIKGKEEKRLEYIFLAKPKNNIIKTQISEIDEFKWFTKKEIEKLENTYEQTKSIIKLINS
ncbi:MAG: NUDIX hydrolase [Candidatus Gracilibacteria bacterium]|nr:NUDIX hydrolase [Candidatus Gracilibacteria bacterium]